MGRFWHTRHVGFELTEVRVLFYFLPKRSWMDIISPNTTTRAFRLVGAKTSFLLSAFIEIQSVAHTRNLQHSNCWIELAFQKKGAKMMVLKPFFNIRDILKNWVESEQIEIFIFNSSHFDSYLWPLLHALATMIGVSFMLRRRCWMWRNHGEKSPGQKCWCLCGRM